MIDKSNLSKEELLERLSALEQENDALKRDSNNLKIQLKKSKEEVIKAKENVAKSKKLLKTLLETDNVSNQQNLESEELTKKYLELLNSLSSLGSKTFLYREFGENFMAFRQTFKELVNTQDPVANRIVYNVFMTMLEESVTLMNCKDSLIKRLFANGKSEKLPPFDMNKELPAATEEILKTSKSLRANLVALTNVGKSLKDALKEQQATDPLTQSMKQISDNTPPERPETEAKKRPGRQQRNNPNGRTLQKVTAGEHEKCRQCGSEELAPIREFIEQIATGAINDAEKLQALDTRHDLMICKHCNRVHLAMKEGDDHPLVPNRTIGTHLLVEIAYWASHGVSLSRLSAEVQRVFNISTETISYNLKDLGNLILLPLVQGLENQLKQEPIVIADETTFSILEAQGRGHQKKDAKTETPRSKNYVVGLATPLDSDHPIVLFKPMAGRGVDCLNQIITADFNFELLVTDAYSAYSALLNADHPDANHQICLIHWRRMLLEAGIPEFVQKEFNKLSEKDKKKFIKKQVAEKGPYTQLISILEAIQKIYRYREDSRLHPENSEKNLEQQRQLMDNIDVIVEALSAIRVTIGKNGGYQSNSKSDRIGCACAYYKNNKSSIRMFLKDSRYPCDSNLIESNIRNVAIIRKNIGFKQTMEHTTALLNILSVFCTLRINGITNPTKWLCDYCQAVYIHIAETAWTEALADGADPSKKLNTYAVKERLKDFDVTPFLPWNKPN